MSATAPADDALKGSAGASRTYGKPGDGRPVYVPDTRITWHGLGGYVDAVNAEVCSWKASTYRYNRNDRLYRSITVEDITSCYDQVALGKGAKLFDHGRWERSPSGIGSSLGRETMGALLVECRNQSERLAKGITRKRVKGPELDPTRIPTTRLLVLIQQHQDMMVVEQLRRELARRSNATRTD